MLSTYSEKSQSLNPKTHQSKVDRQIPVMCHSQFSGNVMRNKGSDIAANKLWEKSGRERAPLLQAYWASGTLSPVGCYIYMRHRRLIVGTLSNGLLYATPQASWPVL